MEIKVPPGIRFFNEVTVTESDSAKHFGSGLVDVFATPAMIALLEKTAMESVQEYLPEGFASVGTEVHIKHLKATPMGGRVKAESFLKSYDGKKLLFELHAWDEKGMIGIGTHTRVIIQESGFMDKIRL